MVLDSDEEDSRGADDGGSGDSDFSDLWSERVKARKSPPPAASRRPAWQREKVTYFEDEDDEDDIDSIVVK